MDNSSIVQIHWTCGSLQEARRISRLLVQERLVACANMIPWIESVFSWEGKLETQQETKVIFKTLESHFEKVKEVILKNAKYEVPEILMVPVIDGNPQYIEWVLGTVGSCRKENSVQ